MEPRKLNDYFGLVVCNSYAYVACVGPDTLLCINLSTLQQCCNQTARAMTWCHEWLRMARATKLRVTWTVLKPPTKSNYDSRQENELGRIVSKILQIVCLQLSMSEQRLTMFLIPSCILCTHTR